MNKNKITISDMDKIYENYNGQLFCPREEFFNWIAQDIFNLTTYDGWIDYVFTKDLLKVMTAIYNHTTFDFIRSSKHNYLIFIEICNLLEKKNWIEWGTSIRGCWFDSDYSKEYLIEEEEIPFNDNNVKVFIEWLKAKFNEKDYKEYEDMWNNE